MKSPAKKPVLEYPRGELSQRILQKTPFIVRGYSKEISEYGLDYIQKHYAEQNVSVLNKVEHNKKYNQVINHHEDVYLNDFIKHIKSGETELYLERADIYTICPGLQPKLPIQDLYNFGIESATNCWIGPKGTKVDMHFDADDNFFIQADGRKEVNLISPQDTKYCYMISRSFYDAYSEVDSYNPDLNKYPEFANATIYNAVLFPGDMLFIPSGWWHHIESLNVSVTYNIWWLGRLKFTRYLMQETLHRFKSLFGLAPPIETKESYYDTLCSLIKDR